MSREYNVPPVSTIIVGTHCDWQKVLQKIIRYLHENPDYQIYEEARDETNEEVQEEYDCDNIP